MTEYHPADLTIANLKVQRGLAKATVASIPATIQCCGDAVRNTSNKSWQQMEAFVRENKGGTRKTCTGDSQAEWETGLASWLRKERTTSSSAGPPVVLKLADVGQKRPASEMTTIEEADADEDVAIGGALTPIRTTRGRWPWSQGRPGKIMLRLVVRKKPHWFSSFAR